MSDLEKELINELNVYSGLDSFNSTVIEKELKLCAELGADVEKIKALKFNALQLAEIRKGLENPKVDVTKYIDPKYSWTDMEEMRLEMAQGIDMSSYRAQGFDNHQLYQIRVGLMEGIDVSAYAKMEYLADQMREIRKGLSKVNGVPIIFYQDPQFDSLQMREIRKGLQAGIDISNYAMLSMPYLKMRAIRKSAEDGLYFDDSEMARYNAGVLEQIHQAYLDKVDISEYVKKRFDAEQLEQIRISLKENLPIDKYITTDMRGDAIKEIRLGLEAGVDVGRYASDAYGWKQMFEMRTGLEHQIDIQPFCKPLYRADQMREIRLGIEAGLDVSRFSSMMYTARDMRRIREKLLSGELQSVVFEDGAVSVKAGAAEVSVLDRTNGTSDQSVLISSMLQDRDKHLVLSQDHMKCWLKLPLREDGIQYTEDAIMTFLFKTKVVRGIDREAIKRMLEKPDPTLKYLVASGKEVSDGTDGYYEYFFDTEYEADFKYLPDGSIDFSDIQMIQQVKVGDKLALYHKATKGEDGYNVHGEILKSKNGKEIPILKGDGFMIMSDRVTYVAKITGAVSMDDGMINIKRIMILPEVKITDQKINYDGVVYVRGDVNSGSEIKATGDIVIGGHLESSIVESKSNVIIAGGATCPNTGSITAGGNITAKFFEGVKLKGKDISANYFIDCKVEASGVVKTYGRKGVIYGGTVQSLEGLESASIGNKTGVKTMINLGVSVSLLTEYSKIQKEIGREIETLKTLMVEREKLAELGAGDRQLMQWKIKVNAAINSKEQIIRRLQAKKESFDKEIQKGNNAKVTVTEYIYAGTVLVIEGVVYKVTEDRHAIDKLVYRTDANKENIICL